MDLLVTRNFIENNNVVRVWQIIYEGKGGNSNDHFPDILRQLERYGSRLVNDRHVYMIGAKGDKVMFWRYTRSRNDGYLEGIYVRPDGLIYYLERDEGLPPHYNIILHQTEIALILEVFAQNPL